MRGIKKVIYWHRFGQKVYDVGQNSSPILEKEVESSNIEDVEEGLKYLSNQSVLLLLSDSISYLYEKIINPPLPVDENFRKKLQDIIKADIPEDFSEFVWDYKVENDFDGKQKVIIFAPIKEFQTLIDEISNKLMIKIEAMETESVAASRDPNPILGIIKKPDIKGKDDEVLNLSVAPEDDGRGEVIKVMGIITLIILLIAGAFLGLSKLKGKIFNNSSKKQISMVTITAPSPVPSVAPSPEAVKEWSTLSVVVQNGTSQAGLASKVAKKIIEAGIGQVESGNADKKDYLTSILIFKNDSLKESYQEKFKNLISVNDSDIKVDDSIDSDVILILGSD